MVQYIRDKKFSYIIIHVNTILNINYATFICNVNITVRPCKPGMCNVIFPGMEVTLSNKNKTTCQAAVT